MVICSFLDDVPNLHSGQLDSHRSTSGKTFTISSIHDKDFWKRPALSVSQMTITELMELQFSQWRRVKITRVVSMSQRISSWHTVSGFGQTTYQVQSRRTRGHRPSSHTLILP